MAKLMLRGIAAAGTYSAREITQAEYDALPREEQLKGEYWIKDRSLTKDYEAKDIVYDDTKSVQPIGTDNVQDAVKIIKDNIDEISEAMQNKPDILTFTNVNIEVSSWIEDATYEDFGFKADIICNGVTANYIPNVIFNMTDVTSGKFSPIAKSGNEIITIYANEKPTNTIVIASIYAIKYS